MGYLLGLLIVLLIIYLLPSFLLLALGVYITLVLIQLVRSFFGAPKKSQREYTQSCQQSSYRNTTNQNRGNKNSDIIDVEYTEHEVDE